MNQSQGPDLFCRDPFAYYGHSITRMHTQPREELDKLHLAALQLRFAQLRDAIPMVKKLADAEGIHEIKELDAVIPLLFDHSMYKSYPPSMLHQGRFDQMTRWLNKLTAIDLSGFDASDCPTVDDWVVKLKERTPLDVVHTSGTTGLFSFLPRTKSNWDTYMTQYRVSILQEFGKDGSLEHYPLNIDAIYPYFRSGGGHLMLNDYYVKYICGAEERFHSAYPGRLSSNLLLLFSQMRAAAARGELDRFEISPDLLARREEFVKLQETRDQHVARFLQEVSQQLRGKRIFMQAVPGMLYQMAKAGLERGDKGLFAGNSIIVAGGGAKGYVMPDNWDEFVKEYLGAERVAQIFGMGEMILFFPLCSHDHYHATPGIIPFVLDPDTSRPLPRKGRVTGRWAHYDLMSDSHWGGFITGDEVTVNWDCDCPCGRTTPYLDKTIRRYSDIAKGGDKITCAATEGAYQEAMDFLVAAEPR